MIQIKRLLHICDIDPKYVLYGNVTSFMGDVEWPGGYVRCPHCSEALPAAADHFVNSREDMRTEVGGG